MMWQRAFRQWFVLVLVLVCVTSCELERYGANTALPEVECQPGEWRNDSGNCQPAGLPLDMKCAPGELELSDGRCQPAGLPLDMKCQPGKLELADGRCQPAGVPPEMCGEGFEPDGKMGCNAILPAEACPFGLMAVPGETECREVAPCGEGKWGDIPVDATTQFVDGAYPGNDSDGTKERPWKTIAKGIWEAKSGAVVAVAEGTYQENLLINKSLKLWGVCPKKVTVVGVGTVYGAIEIAGNHADGTEVRNLAIRGASNGLNVYGVRDVTIDQIWIHDTDRVGIDLWDYPSAASITLSSSLLETTHEFGIYISGADALVSGSVVRDTLFANGFAIGIQVQDNETTGRRANLIMQGSVLEKHPQTGSVIFASDVRIESSAVRDIGGVGLAFVENPNDGAKRASAVLVNVTVERVKNAGIQVSDSDAWIEQTVVRNAQGVTDDQGGGINVFGVGAGSKVTVLASVVEENEHCGLYVEGSEATIEASIIRNTYCSHCEAPANGVFLNNYNNGLTGRPKAYIRGSIIENNENLGILLVAADLTLETTIVRGSGMGGVYADEGSEADIMASIIESNHWIGIKALGANVELSTSVVRNTLVDPDGVSGFGVDCQEGTSTHSPSTVVVRGALIVENHELGIRNHNSNLTVEASVIRATQPSSNGHGWGIYTYGDSLDGRYSATIKATTIEKNRELAMLVEGTDADIDSCIIDTTIPNLDGFFGRGISVQSTLGGDPSNVNIRTSIIRNNRESGLFVEASNATIHGSLLSKNHEIGLFVVGSNATINASIVRGTEPNAFGLNGRGINIQGREGGGPSKVAIWDSLSEENYEIGLFVSSSDVKVESSTIRGTKTNASGQFGDGISIASVGNSANVTLTDVRVEDSKRASISNFGGTVDMFSSTLQCSAFDITSQYFNGYMAAFFDKGNNHCGCPDATGVCIMANVVLEPPTALPPIDADDPTP